MLERFLMMRQRFFGDRFAGEKTLAGVWFIPDHLRGQSSALTGARDGQFSHLNFRQLTLDVFTVLIVFIKR